MLDFPLYYQLTRLYADYAAALDAEEWEKWPDFFLEDCVYKVLPAKITNAAMRWRRWRSKAVAC